MEDNLNRINFMVGTMESEKEVIVKFQGFASEEETLAYADWLSENLALLLDESSSTVH
tara:strand:- start:816 stop:989 length:174 start_codon:yes stop_codon:yes gene_type:complete